MGQEATYAVQQKSGLFDHLVGNGEQRTRHFEAERFGGSSPANGTPVELIV
jgi:hypothetical protein